MFVFEAIRKLRTAVEHRRYVSTCRQIAASGPCGVRLAWHQDLRTCLWAHAGGGRFHVYGNSQEAYDDAIDAGYGVIEADVMMTADGVPVMSHRFRPNNEIVFDRTPTVDEFLATPLNGRYTPMTLEDFVRRYDGANVFFSIDPSPAIRADNLGHDLVSFLANKTSDLFKKKIIYQINGLAQLRHFKANNPFGALHYGLDAEIGDEREWWRIQHLLPALQAVGVGSVSICDMPIVDEDRLQRIIRSLNSANIRVSIPGVNSLGRLKRWRSLGANCFNTDFLRPEDVIGAM